MVRQFLASYNDVEKKNENNGHENVCDRLRSGRRPLLSFGHSRTGLDLAGTALDGSAIDFATSTTIIGLILDGACPSTLVTSDIGAVVYHLG
jgi:hypothetical protein